MKIPIIKYNDNFLKNLSIFMSIGGITLFPFIILREKYKNNPKNIIRHESIHIKQQIEMLVIPFYVVYLLNYIFNLVYYRLDVKRAYRNISFEREAYENEYDANYLKYRKINNYNELGKRS